MKTISLDLWLRLILRSVIGALVYYLSPAPKVKELRNKK